MAYTKYSLTPANNNATPPDGAPEGMLPSAVNDTMRDMMAQIRDCGDGIRDGTYTMTAPKITGGTITGAAFTGNTFTSPVISGGTINNAVIGGSTAAAGTFTSLSDSGNLTFTGTGNRITGDFSSGVASRVLVQSSTTNGATSFSLISNGTSTNSTFTAFAGSDAANSNGIQISANGSAARLVAINNGTSSAVPITFGQGNTEQMRIDTSGNVGIGTSSPNKISGTTILSINTATAANYAGLDISTADAVRTALYANNSASYLETRTSTPLVFGTNTTERMRITSAGNVGIGTNNPSALLHVSNASAKIRIGVDGSSQYTDIFRDNFTGYTVYNAAQAATFRGHIWQLGGSEAMRIDSSGNVGIGTSSPSSKLTISGADDMLQMYSSTATSYQRFFGSTTTASPYLGASGNDFVFGSWGIAERMRIDSSGNVGIGVTPSAWNSSVRAIQLNNTSSVWAFTGQSRIGNNLFYDAGGAFKYLTTNPASDFSQTTNGFTWSWATSGSAGATATLSSLMVLNANGALVLSGGDQGANGVGITFPATQSASSNANTLDDYEEGDFTPTLTASTSGTITTTDRRGRYVKVGRQVTIVGYINVASVSSPVGDLRLGGFPFAAASDSDGAGCLQPYGFATTNTFTAIYFSTVASQTYGNIRGLNNGDQVTTMAANTKTNAGFQFTATYFV